MKNSIIIPEVNFRNETSELGFEIANLNYLFTTNSSKHLQRPHRITFFAILFITDGTGEHQIDFKSYSYKRNDIIFIGSEQVHSWLDYKNTQGYVIFFTEEFLRKNQIKFKDLSYSYPYNSILYKPKISLKSKTKAQTFNELVTYMHNEYNDSGSFEKQEILQCLLRTFLLKIRALNKDAEAIVQNKNIELFIKFQELLNKKLSSSRNAKDYCVWLNISYKKLNTICKELTNKSAKAFIDSLLMLQAKKHLSDNDKSISEISYLLGFEEATNFTKYFTKHAQKSPSAFRSSLRIN
ncbi:MAG: helix-turn-helix domain-containing protein [Flavobacteriales bacterium]